MFLNSLPSSLAEPQENMEILMNQGMKQESCEPLTSVKNEDGVGYNKLPHYFSSGKPRCVVVSVY